MLFVRPDYYDDFHCIADKCIHSCCKDWEIDIDRTSLEAYMRTGGSIGKKLREKISCEGDPHFILNENGCCPFLRDDGLCEMILELGEDSLCYICSEHPRFYNDLPGREEVGVSACCEEAMRLIVSGKEPVRLIVEDDGEDDVPDAPVIRLRDEIFACLHSEKSFYEAMCDALLLVGEKPFDFVPSAIAEFLLSLERMYRRWTVLLTEMKAYADTGDLFTRLNDIRYRRIAHYFIYCHFVFGDLDGASRRLIFSFLSTMIVCFLDGLGHSDEALRLYSTEIEYSDKNADLILDAIASGSLI